MTAPALRTIGRSIAPKDAVGWLTTYLILLLFIPSRLVVGPLGSAGAPSMLFGIGSLLLWVLLFFAVDRRTTTQSQPIRVALGVFLFSVGISYVLAMSSPMSPDERSPADVAILALASWSGTLLLTQDGIYERRRLETLLWRFAVCGGLIAMLGLVQIATRQLWVDQLSIPGLEGTPSYGLGSRGGFPRPAGTAIHPIEYGVLLAMLLPLAIHVGLYQTQRATLVRWLPAGALLGVIPLSSSRSAYLGALIAGVIYMLGWPRARRLRALGLGVAGIFAMMVVTPNLLSFIIGLFTGAGDDPSIESRTNSYSVAFEFVDRNPLFGRGLGTFLPKYRIFDNQYLLLLVTIGVVGMLAFITLGVTAVVTTARLRRRLQDEASRDLALSLAAAISAGFTCLFMFDAFAFPMTMGSLFLILGMAGALRRTAPTTDDQTARRLGGLGA